MRRPSRARGALLASMVILASCRRGENAASDSGVGTTTVVRAAGAPTAWMNELGPMLVIPSDSENTAVVLFPAAPSAQAIQAAPIMLLSAAGEAGSSAAELVVSDSQVCGEAPTIRLRAPVPQDWAIGLRTRLAALRLDSIETLGGADSARLAADLARLASTVPSARESRFSGLPFVVLTARRFTAGGRQIAAAHLLRRLPQEAAPLEEHLFVLGERGAGSANEPLTLAFGLRSEGSEDTADHYEVLGGLQGPSATYLFLSRDRESQTRYDVLVRDDSAWRVRWSRTLAC